MKVQITNGIEVYESIKEQRTGFIDESSICHEVMNLNVNMLCKIVRCAF
jgi:hypothetical protein